MRRGRIRARVSAEIIPVVSAVRAACQDDVVALARAGAAAALGPMLTSAPGTAAAVARERDRPRPEWGEKADQLGPDPTGADDADRRAGDEAPSRGSPAFGLALARVARGPPRGSERGRARRSASRRRPLPPSRRRPGCMRPASNHISIPAAPSCTQRTPGRIDRRSNSTSSPGADDRVGLREWDDRSAAARGRRIRGARNRARPRPWPRSRQGSARSVHQLAGTASRRSPGEHIRLDQDRRASRAHVPPARRGRGRRAPGPTRGDGREAPRSRLARRSRVGSRPRSRQITSAPSAGRPVARPRQAHGERLDHRRQPKALVAREREQRAAVVERGRIGRDRPISSTIAPSGSGVPRDDGNRHLAFGDEARGHVENQRRPFRRNADRDRVRVQACN